MIPLHCSSCTVAVAVSVFVAIANSKRLIPEVGSLSVDASDGASALVESASEEDGELEHKNIWKRFAPFDPDKETGLQMAAEWLKKYEKRFTLFDGEKIQLAFKKGRDAMLLTDKRYVFVDGVKFSTKTTFFTIAYSSVLGFAVESAGTFDIDSEMNLYTGMVEKPFVKVEFQKDVDIFEIQKFLCGKVIGESYGKSSLVESQASSEGPNGFMAYLKGEGVEVDPAKYEAMLRDEDSPVLQDDEKVEVAFKIARDSMVLTSKRILLIDVQGFTGQKIEYLSLPYTSIGAYQVETAGGFFSGDTDSELKIWTTIPYGPMVSFEREIRKGLGDIMKVQMILSEKVMGGTGYGKSSLMQSSDDTHEEIRSNRSTRTGKGGGDGGEVGKMNGFLSYFSGDNAVQINPQTAENQLEANSKVLIDGEHVKLAFKVGRDMTLMTTHRMIFVDSQGTGVKVEYKSIPYSHIVGYAIETAGFADNDAELKVWTDIASDPDIPPEPPLKACQGPGADGELPPPCPKEYEYPWAPRKKGMAYFEQDLRKGYADIFAIQMLLSEKVLGGKPGSSLIDLSSSSGKSDNEGPLSSVMGWLGKDALPVSASKIESEFRTSQPILMDDETVELPFKVREDLTVLTSHRVLLIDRKVGKKWGGGHASVEYKSIPYHSIRAYSVESAGMGFNSDAEMEFFTRFTWPLEGGKHFDCLMDRPCRTLASDKPYYKKMVIHQDLQKDKADLTAIQKFMSQKLLSRTHGSSLLEQKDEKFDPMAWFNAAHKEVDKTEAQETLLKEIDPFIEGEELFKAYQTGRDLIYVTNKRIMVKDRQGFFGKKTEYKSIPYTSIQGMSMTLAGWFLDVDEEIYLETDSWSVRSVQKNFHKSQANIKEVFDTISRELI